MVRREDKTTKTCYRCGLTRANTLWHMSYDDELLEKGRCFGCITTDSDLIGKNGFVLTIDEEGGTQILIDEPPISVELAKWATIHLIEAIGSINDEKVKNRLDTLMTEAILRDASKSK